MKINTIGENRIEIYLSNEEIDEIFGGYGLIDYDIPDCRAKINSLISSAIPETALPLDCKRVLIEVKPLKYGCTISFVRIYTAAKKFHAVNKTKRISLIFNNSDDLISSVSALKKLGATKSQLFQKKNKYAIIANIKTESQNLLLHIGEYCTVFHREMDAVLIEEYWHPICRKNAINRLLSAFLN